MEICQINEPYRGKETIQRYNDGCFFPAEHFGGIRIERENGDGNRQRLKDEKGFSIRHDFIDQGVKAEYRPEVVTNDEKINTTYRIIPQAILIHAHIPDMTVKGAISLNTGVDEGNRVEQPQYDEFAVLSKHALRRKVRPFLSRISRRSVYIRHFLVV